MTRARPQTAGSQAAMEGRLLARPVAPAHPGPTGLQKLGLGGDRDGLLYVPAGYRPEQPAPLALLLHGAGGNAEHGLWLLQAYADATGMILLSPDSRRPTWDIIMNRYGPDIAFIDQALALTFDRYVVDPTHLAIGGFSDGASYALSVGLTNGDLFTHILAFSPGFMLPGDPHGRPDIYIAHGTHDTVLPIDRCSRRIVPQLERAGYPVVYREFDGPHTVPPEIAREAVDRFLQPPG